MFRIPATFFSLLLLVACSSGESARPQVDPTGPPSLRAGVVRRHAAEFRSDLADRPAGSEGEQAASAYILGHLQQAGYVVLLDSVPLADLVRSTNVVAQPPSGEDPLAVVAVPFDEPPAREQADRQGEELAIMLELARALRVAASEHSVEFVALGAEYADEGGGRLGSRRLAQALLDSGTQPLVVLVRADPGLPDIEFLGDVPPELADATGAPEALEGNVFVRAGFEVVEVAGPPGEVGKALLEFLAEAFG